MVGVLLIAVCYAAGLAVHYRWHDRTAVPSLSFDEPVDPPGGGSFPFPLAEAFTLFG